MFDVYVFIAYLCTSSVVCAAYRFVWLLFVIFVDGDFLMLCTLNALACSVNVGRLSIYECAPLIISVVLVVCGLFSFENFAIHFGWSNGFFGCEW